MNCSLIVLSFTVCLQFDDSNYHSHQTEVCYQLSFAPSSCVYFTPPRSCVYFSTPPSCRPRALDRYKITAMSQPPWLRFDALLRSSQRQHHPPPNTSSLMQIQDQSTSAAQRSRGIKRNGASATAGTQPPTRSSPPSSQHPPVTPARTKGPLRRESNARSSTQTESPPLRTRTQAITKALAPNTAKIASGSCVVCGDDCTADSPPQGDSAAIKLECGCIWCRDCLTEVFTRSTTDRELMPPKCCNKDQPIPSDQARKILAGKEHRALWQTWYSKREEWQEGALHCPVRGCGEFIPQALQTQSRSGILQCHECKTRICPKCKNIHHGAKACPKPGDDADAYAFDAMMEGSKWMRCPGCKVPTSRDEGCNHMQCLLCRCNFCFICGEKWHEKRCICPYCKSLELFGVLSVLTRAQTVETPQCHRP